MLLIDINPIAFSIGPVEVRYYGLLFSLGFILAYLIVSNMFKREGKNTKDLDQLLVYLFFGTIIGARLGHCFFYEPEYYLQHPIEILKVWKGGLASHGGTLGLFVAAYFFLRRHKQYSFFEIADYVAIPIALVATMIRLGNFINAEILGTYFDGPWSVTFAALHDNMPRHPVQIYESLTYFTIFLLLLAIYFFYSKKPQGFIFSLMFTLVFTSRLFLEQYKVEQADYSTNSLLTVGQILSLPFILLGIGLLIFVFKRGKRGTR